MYTLGINLSHHSSIALLKDNEVVLFVLEERINRIKNCRTIPIRSLKLVSGITNFIDVVMSVSGKKEEHSKCVDILRKSGVEVKSNFINNPAHHLYHAAAGFYMSHFDTASCLVIDGAGAIKLFREQGRIRASETTSVYEANYDTGFECTYKNYTIGIYDSNWQFGDDLSISVDVTQDEINSFLSTIKNIKKVEASTKSDIGLKYSIVTRRLGFGGAGEGKTMGLSAYGPIQKDANSMMAYEVQKELEQVFIERVKLCRSNNLVVSGGCGLNILGNSLIKKTYPHLNIYVDPVSADGTISLGAAVHTFYSQTKCKDKLVFNPYGGLRYNLNKTIINELTRKYSV